jgi:hypothetical protein
MEKYIVKVINLFSTFVEVDAENEEQARSLAKDHLQNGEQELEHFYEGTASPEEWPVSTKAELEKNLEKVAEQENQEDNKL